MRRIYTIAPLLLAGLAGCGSDDPNDKAPLVPVSGKITLNGKPLADARVLFMPDPGNKYNTPGVDATGPEGNYQLKFKTRSGISVGKYKVSVEPSLAAADAGKMPDAFKDDPVMWKMEIKAKEKANRGGGKKVQAGTKFTFEAEVAEGGGEFDFDAKQAASAAK